MVPRFNRYLSVKQSIVSQFFTLKYLHTVHPEVVCRYPFIFKILSVYLVLFHSLSVISFFKPIKCFISVCFKEIGNIFRDLFILDCRTPELRDHTR